MTGEGSTTRDLGELINEMRKREEAGTTGQLILTLLQGQCAMKVKKACPKTWKADLQENVGCRKSTWHQRVAIFRDFGPFLLPEIPDDHVSTLPSSLALLTSITKGTDEACRQAHLEQIAGLSYADVKKYVAEIKGKEPCECSEWEEKIIKVCKSCGKRAKAEGGDS